MTGNDEKRQLELELLAADLKLRRKQEFWETPRNVAILVGVTAAIAAAIGFWLGQRSAPSPPTTTPARVGTIDPMSATQFIDAVQTAGIVVIALMVVYAVVRLDRTLTLVAEKVQGALGDVMRQQSQIQANARRIWERIDLIEAKPDRDTLGDAVARVWERVLKIEARLDATEKGEPRPEGTRPTDPPYGSAP